MKFNPLICQNCKHEVKVPIGLCDQNGNELYFGDIVEDPINPEYKYPIRLNGWYLYEDQDCNANGRFYIGFEVPGVEIHEDDTGHQFIKALKVL